MFADIDSINFTCLVKIKSLELQRFQVKILDSL